MKHLFSSDGRQYLRLLRSLPLQDPIFLPTERLSLRDAIDGLSKVKKLYEETLDTVHRPRLKDLRSLDYPSDRCFVIGNGPSLNATDLDRLKGETTFATNGFFLKAAELSWSPTFYVVEDHLVAEDRSREINRIRGSTCLFPAYLAYCLDETPSTVFFDHRPRKSFPHSFDFSPHADQCTYAGCTVTFTCLQLAVFLGFRKIFLVGVDADYAIPADASVAKRAGPGVLDMSSDDPNHFDPDYFGKGFRWHDPQVDKMLEAYQAAKRVCDELGVSIVNATVGGKLEVFPRASYDSLFDDAHHSRSAPYSEDMTSAVRVAIFDITSPGDGTATGELKANLLADLSDEQKLCVFSGPLSTLSMAGVLEGAPFEINGAQPALVVEHLHKFEPTCVLYRPVPENPTLHQFAMQFLRAHPLPLVIWIMDDWPNRLKSEGDPRYQSLNDDLRWLLDRSTAQLCISNPMKNAFYNRYGLEFTPLANGVDVSEWPCSPPRNSGVFTLCYAGALAENMSLNSICRVAAEIESLNREGSGFRFHINTRESWAETARPRLAQYRSCRITTNDYSREEYVSFLQSGDANLIAYNFDEQSRTYVQYSLANKLPECLASGIPLLVYGPRGICTVDMMRDMIPETVVSEEGSGHVADWLRKLSTSHEAYKSLGAACRKLASNQFNIHVRRGQFNEILQTASTSSQLQHLAYASREEGVNLDESELVSLLTNEWTGSTFTMLDVGAHRGSSAEPFVKKGWRVVAFEPDGNNRSALTKKFSNCEQVQIDPRAVGKHASSKAAFYTSKESDGISGLIPFHSTHETTTTVEVTSLHDVVESYGLSRIDFLKIDVEGYDFPVIQGIPWEKIRPEIIVCEFEDSKTQHLGHSWRDIAEFLVGKGYAVYVSEWYPVIRYGIQHQWRSLRLYPCDLADPQAWGNLVAFRTPPSTASITCALGQLTEVTYSSVPLLRSLLVRTKPYVPVFLKRLFRWIRSLNR